MPGEGSVSRWLDDLREGDGDAAPRLWQRYFQRLVGLARQRLREAPRRAADEEDVALSAFDSFFRAAGEGRFPDLADRESLWRLLVTITARKAAHLVRDQGRIKRGGGAVRDEGEDDPLARALSDEPSPAFAAELADEYRRLLARLGDQELASVAVWRMEGYSVEEIAARLGYAPRSIKRKIQLIRDRWQEGDRP
jgi:DNA-directed RNA polymerase specialized sigma24 family protein